jgi:hypothetical protein
MGDLGFNKNDPAIIHPSNAVCKIKDAIIMSDDNQGSILRKRCLAKNFHDQPAGVSI